MNTAEQCNEKFALSGKILNAKTKEQYKEAQDILGKHLCNCQKDECKISLKSRIEVGIQDAEGNYLEGYDPAEEDDFDEDDD